MNKIITEGLDYHDLDGQLESVVTVDEYSAKMGKDCDIITLAFIIRSERAGNDLVDWFERGYDFVLDAQVSEGELSPGKYLVFVEMARRTSAPERLIELLDDLNTLSDISMDEWVIKVDDEDHSADEEELTQVMILSPHSYRERFPDKDEENENEEGLNEMRRAAGISEKRLYHSSDPLLKNYTALAGL
jgi:hypothetical protein